jgi:polycomb group RING finger protein 3
MTKRKQAGAEAPPAVAPPRIHNSAVDFALGPVNAHLTCKLCDGYFRDPITITECLHTFCKSCLYYSFSIGFSKCPTCGVQLGPDPFKSTLHDRTKEQLLDRVLFPELRAKDEALEREFYTKKGIPLKSEFRAEEQKKQRRREATAAAAAAAFAEEVNNADDGGEDMELILTPANSSMPEIQYDLLHTSGKLKILHLKRFLLARLEQQQDPAVVEMTCKGSIVGNELSLTFIQRTMWLVKDVPVELQYRIAADDL